MDALSCIMIIYLPFLSLAFCIIFHPIQRLKNYLFPTYLYNPKDGKSYKLVVYEGYDKHSSVVASVRELGKDYNRYVANEYYTWVKSRTIPKKTVLHLVKGSK